MASLLNDKKKREEKIMFSALIGSVVAVATTTALSAFSEGLVTSLVVYTVAKGGAKATLSLKK